MSLTRLLAVTRTVNTGPFLGWTPNAAAATITNINSIDPSIIGGSDMTTFFAGAAGSNIRWIFDDLPQEANGAAILSFDIESAGRRAGGSVAGNYTVYIQDVPGTTTIISSPAHTPGAPAVPPGYLVFNDNFPTDPNGAVWTQPFINTNLEIGMMDPAPYGTGISVYYLDVEVLWDGAGGIWIARGISIILPLLLPILGGANLYHVNDTEFSKIHRMIKHTAHIVGESSYPSIVLPKERELVYKALNRPTYGV